MTWSSHARESELTFSFINQEVRPEKAANAERPPDKEDFGSKISLVWIHHIGGDDCNDTIPEPVACYAHGHTSRSDAEWEHLSNNHPSSRSPGGRKEENIEADECNFDFDNRGIVASHGSCNGDDELADNHAQSTENQKWSPTEAFNGPE